MVTLKFLMRNMERRNKEKQVEEKEKEKEKAEALKKRISTHPLYALLLENHMDCLKIGYIGDVEQNDSMKQKLSTKKPISSSVSQPELDQFMEAYCLALSKLKEALKEPQHETVAFINSMHLQLRELTTTNYPQASDPSSGEIDN